MGSLVGKGEREAERGHGTPRGDRGRGGYCTAAALPPPLTLPLALALREGEKKVEERRERKQSRKGSCARCIWVEF